jgi:hypothetical protein
MSPDTKLLTMACRPKPTPIPTAPPRNVRLLQIEPGRLETDHQAEEEDHVAEEVRERVALPRVERRVAENAPVHDPPPQAGPDGQGDEENERLDDEDRRDVQAGRPRAPPRCAGRDGTRAC